MIPQELGDATDAMVHLTYCVDQYLDAKTPIVAASRLVDVSNALSQAQSWLPCWDDRCEWDEDSQEASLDLDDTVPDDGAVDVVVEFRLSGTARIRPDSDGYSAARNPDGSATLRRLVAVDRAGFLDQGSDALFTIDAFDATPVSMHVVTATRVDG